MSKKTCSRYCPFHCALLQGRTGGDYCGGREYALYDRKYGSNAWRYVTQLLRYIERNYVIIPHPTPLTSLTSYLKQTILKLIFLYVLFFPKYGIMEHNFHVFEMQTHDFFILNNMHCFRNRKPYTVKKVLGYSVLSQDVTYQIHPGRE